VSGNLQQLNPVARIHLKNQIARAHFLLYQNFQLRILRRTGKGEIRRRFARYRQHGNLSGYERDAMNLCGSFRQKIE